MAGKKNLYDLDELRALPILEVCDHLGLPVEKRGKNFWCKVRPETKASVILHPDTNQFYDFGNCEHGNNIDLVRYARGIPAGKAIRELAEAFDISPSVSGEEKLSKPMNAWEYKKIGLYDDLATKNLVFPVTSSSVDELLEMEYAYRMPMNQLRTQAPAVYRHILETKAIPYVENKRELYYLSVWNYYCFLQMMNRGVLFFDSEKTAAKFEGEMKSLEQSERALRKACLGTGISLPERKQYDPQRVFSLMTLGRLSVSLGPGRPEDIQIFAEDAKCALCERTITYDEYCAADLDGHPHSAVLQKGQILLTFPEGERSFFERIFAPKEPRKPRLDAALAQAGKRQQQLPSEQKRTPEPVR